MASPDGGGRIGQEEEAKNDVKGQIILYQYYHPQVNNFGAVNNATLGANYGASFQNTGDSTRPPAGSTATPVATPGPNENTVPSTSSIPKWPSNLTVLLNPIPDASYTRDRKRSPPDSACFPGSRKGVIKQILSWANSSLLFRNSHIMWVYGYAGCGKSAIAQEIAQLLAEQKRLAASFFFFRGAANRSRTSRFATSVAHQVAAAIPATAPLIEAAIRANPALVTSDTALSAQFEHLIYGPIDDIKSDSLAASLRQVSYLIVLDGLDECADHDEVAAFIERMIAFFKRKPSIPLRFLITSRVENHIHSRLFSSKQVQLLNLVQNTSDADILTALEAAIDREKQGLVMACAKSWPSAEEKAKLVKHIGGSFIFLATIVKLIFKPYTEDKLTPMERLPLILGMQPDFDGLYRAILEPSQDFPHFQDIISAIALAQEPLSIAQIAELLNIEATKVANVVITLSTIMHIPGDDRTPVTLWHTSLRDFLCTKARAGIFLANRRSMAYWCISYIYRSTTSPASSSISDYANRFALFHWEECIKSEGEKANPNTVRKLAEFLKRPPKDGCKSLEAAVHSENWTVVRALADTNADLSVRFNQPRDGIHCALHAACYYEQRALVHLLLEKGADPNFVSECPLPSLAGPYHGDDFRHGTALAFAAWEEDVELVTHLLECGANPNLQGGVWGTALRAACWKGSLEVVNLLLDHGADPNLLGRTGKGSPFHTCALWGHESCARALLMHNADPNIQDSSGDSPLHFACYYASTKVIECLLEFKADTSIRNNLGQTALQIAQKEKYEDVVQFLSQHAIVE